MTQIFRSEDLGVTWLEITDGVLRKSMGSLALDREHQYGVLPYRVVCRRGIDSHSWDDWEELGPVAADVRIVLALVFHPMAAERLYAVTTDGLFLSTDGARSWTAFRRPAADGWTDPEALFLLNGKDLWGSVDGGGNWAAVGKGLPEDGHINDVAVDPSDLSTLFVATSLGVFRRDRE